jgi:hypothetical protein
MEQNGLSRKLIAVVVAVILVVGVIAAAFFLYAPMSSFQSLKGQRRVAAEGGNVDERILGLWEFGFRIDEEDDTPVFMIVTEYDVVMSAGGSGIAEFDYLIERGNDAGVGTMELFSKQDDGRAVASMSYRLSSDEWFDALDINMSSITDEKLVEWYGESLDRQLVRYHEDHAVPVDAYEEVMMAREEFEYDGNSAHYGLIVADGHFPEKGFWGVWLLTGKDFAALRDPLLEAYRKGLEGGGIITTSEWSNLNPEKWYSICVGPFDSESEANSILKEAKDAGYSDAYVKWSGARR